MVDFNQTFAGNQIANGITIPLTGVSTFTPLVNGATQATLNLTGSVTAIGQTVA
jgi:hypothetical protein